ncbi:MAG TPA: hypothetical protein VEL11_05485, partial [Candidatus Bathyarchaeia archaeon]|nr:hypothetical protein [Candidatus Bathyarchaeia archaeon]
STLRWFHRCEIASLYTYITCLLLHIIQESKFNHSNERLHLMNVPQVTPTVNNEITDFVIQEKVTLE